MDNRKINRVSENKKISAVIFTKDNLGRATNLVNSIQKYVDEIVVVDSSSPQNFGKLLNKLKNKVKLYHFPPLGIVEPFQKLGANLATNQWILHLDDDEIPSKELLNNLAPNNSFSGYLLPRLNHARNIIEYRLRFYNKNDVHFSGIIHWGIIPKRKVKKLNSNQLLYHFENPNLHKWKKYIIVEGYTLGYKILWIVNNKRWHIWNYERDVIAKMFSNLYKKIFVGRGERFAWIILCAIYLFANIIWAARKMGGFKYRLMKIIYYTLIFLNIMKNMDKKIRIWKALYKAGSLYDYLNLNTPHDFEKLKDKNKKGLDLLISLIEEKAKVQK